MTDILKTTVYWSKPHGRFMIVDRAGKARKRDYVAVKQYTDGRIAVERYAGQDYFGVVRMLTSFFPEAKVKVKKSKKRNDANPFPRELAV